MSFLDGLFNVIPMVLPFECLEPRFMQLAFVGLLLLAPMAATIGVQVVSHRLSFFSDAVGHSAFTGVALGLLFTASPHFTMPLFAIFIGVAITFLQRRGKLSTDTAIGVVFSGVVAFGLAIVSRERNLARNLQQFLYGDILTIGEGEILALFLLAISLFVFQIIGYNRMLLVGLNPLLAKAHGVQVALFQYTLAFFLSLIVIFSVWAVGVLLVTALLVVPAATARNLARSGGGMFWWALLVGTSSAVTGLLISAQEWAHTATGATVVLCALGWFLVSLPLATLRGGKIS